MQLIKTPLWIKGRIIGKGIIVSLLKFYESGSIKRSIFCFSQVFNVRKPFGEGSAAWKETDAADKEAKLNIMSQ